MMTPDPNVRVSIAERLVPSLGFAVAALSGAVGGVLVFRFLSALRQAESAGHAGFFGGLSEIEVVVGVILVFAAVLVGLGVLVSVIRMFTANTTASPPGILFLVAGLLSLVPPFALYYCLDVMKKSVTDPSVEGGISSVSGTVTMLVYFAMVATALIAIVLLAFSFIPFSSRVGRKFSPVIGLIVMEVVIAVFIGVFFWAASLSMAERNLDRTDESEAPHESNQSSLETSDSNSNAGDLDGSISTDLDNRDGTETSSNRVPRTISGGVLNSKATSLPQPPYPPAARVARAKGAVTVQVLVDERGEVVSATAVSGHPLLRAAAVQAARGARFTPTKLSGQPVKVNGVITYNFSPE